MSHPAASIKSIISGKINFDTMEDIDVFDNSNYGQSIGNYSNDQDQYDDLSSRHSQESGYSVSSKNLKALSAMQAVNKNLEGRQFYANQSSSTNISVASTASDYQNNYNSDDQAASLSLPTPDDSNYFQNDSFSRPLSRNSTTSCLSITATKDGIEGKKLHRHGPSQYSSNIIANMVHQQQQQLPQTKSNWSNSELVSTSIKTPSAPYRSSASEIAVSNTNQSKASIKNTNAEVDSESGLGGKRSVELNNNHGTIGSFTLKDKIDLLDAERDNENET